MSFTIYDPSGQRFIQWFADIDALLKSMAKNPNNIYHRNA